MTAQPTFALPAYDRSRLTPGIVHIGLGNFHRAHMAVYLDDLFALGEGMDWAIIGAGVRAPDARMRDALMAQDCLSTIIELDPAGKSARRIGAMIDFLPVSPDNAALIAAMARPEIRIVSLTVTEGGYFVDPATGQFDPTHPDILADAKHPDLPATAFGAILAALRVRQLSVMQRPLLLRAWLDAALSHSLLGRPGNADSLHLVCLALGVPAADALQ